jgi:hypothetical protein
MRESYFAEVGWGQKTAIPSVESLRALGLGDLVKDLHPEAAPS